MGEGVIEEVRAFRKGWQPGSVPIAVVMISLNEAHNMEGVLQNLKGWAEEVFLVDSFSADETIDIALQHGVHVVQRKFRGFGDQWNFALNELPITSPWTMKLDPDERVSDQLKSAIEKKIKKDDSVGIAFDRRLWFMGGALPIKQRIIRAWKTGRCQFTDVAVNEHPQVNGVVSEVEGDLEHHDSPDLHHWYEKQNRYSTAEAQAKVSETKLADNPRLFGTSLQRRMWIKKWFEHIPFRFLGVFIYYYMVKGLWRAGWVGYAWSRLRSNVYLMRHLKTQELRLLGRTSYSPRIEGVGLPDDRVKHFE